MSVDDSKAFNPFETPTHTIVDPFTTVVHIEQHAIAVTGEMVPAFLPLIGKYLVSVDGNPPITSAQLRWQEKIEFPLTFNQRVVKATFETKGFAIGAQPFRILVDGKPVIESQVRMKRWWASFILGIMIGAVIGPLIFVVGVIVWYLVAAMI